MSTSVREGSFDVVVAAAPGISVWPSVGVRALGVLCAEMGLSVGLFGGDDLRVRGVIPNPGTGGVMIAEDVRNRIHRIQARAIVKVSPPAELPDPFPGWRSAGLVPLSTAVRLRQESQILWEPSIVILGTGNRALRFGSELLETGTPEAICVETLAEWGAKRFAGWEVERRRFEMNGGRIVEGHPLMLAQKAPLRWELKLQDGQGTRLLETARVVSAGPFGRAGGLQGGYREHPPGSLLFELEQSSGILPSEGVEGWARESESARLLGARIVRSLVLQLAELGERREELERIHRRSRARLRRYARHFDEPFSVSYHGKWLVPADSRRVRSFSGAPQELQRRKPVASVECFEEIACDLCGQICPTKAIDLSARVVVDPELRSGSRVIETELRSGSRVIETELRSGSRVIETELRSGSRVIETELRRGSRVREETEPTHPEPSLPGKVLRENACISCGLCVKTCPSSAIVLLEDREDRPASRMTFPSRERAPWKAGDLVTLLNRRGEALGNARVTAVGDPEVEVSRPSAICPPVVDTTGGHPRWAPDAGTPSASRNIEPERRSDDEPPREGKLPGRMPLEQPVAVQLVQVGVPAHLVWDVRHIRRPVKPSTEDEAYLKAVQRSSKDESKVEITLDGERRLVRDQVPVTVALFETGRNRPEDALFCRDEDCRLCLLSIDGATKLACQAVTHRGMAIRRDAVPQRREADHSLCPCLGITTEQVARRLSAGHLQSPEAVLSVEHVGEGKCHGRLCMGAFLRLLKAQGLEVSQWIDWRFPWSEWILSRS